MRITPARVNGGRHWLSDASKSSEIIALGRGQRLRDTGGANGERHRLAVIKGVSSPERSGVAGRSVFGMADNGDYGRGAVLGASASTKGALW